MIVNQFLHGYEKRFVICRYMAKNKEKRCKYQYENAEQNLCNSEYETRTFDYI